MLTVCHDFARRSKPGGAVDGAGDCGVGLGGVSAIVELPKVQVREPTEEEFAKFALAKGYVLRPVNLYKREIAQSIAAHLVRREGRSIYQMVAFSIPMFARAAAEALFPEDLKIKETSTVVTWEATSQTDVVKMLGSMLSDERATMCAGVSRALTKKSEKHIYTIATIFANKNKGPLTISWVRQATRGEQLYINFQYTVFTQDRELIPPKDDEKADIVMELEEQTAARAITRGNPPSTCTRI